MDGLDVGVVIPAYGHVEMTQTITRDCLREPVKVFVVDNAGDYEPVADEQVIRPGKNLGWLRGTNLGLIAAAEQGLSHLVPLNNDTRLSSNFFAGLTAAAAANPDAGLIAPSYDDVVLVQRHYDGPAAAYIPEPREDPAKLIDGTCFLIPLSTFRAVGELDARHFGRRGWGAIEDYCIRVRAEGLLVLVTRRSYLNHTTGSTARARETAYVRYAASEYRRGMRRKWGKRWREHFDPETVAPASRPRDRLTDFARHVEDRLGLVNTRIGRRGVEPEQRE